MTALDDARATTLPAPGTVAGTVAGTRRGWAAVFGVMFACTWCGNQFTPLLLLYKQHEHFSSVTVNALLGVYVLGLAPALLVSGALSDRFGRRPVMFAGVLCALAAGTCLAFGALGPEVIAVGRLLAGVTVGTATSVGTSWLKELSQPPFDPDAEASSGARRASLAFALGSGTGALVAGIIAQWGPWPEQLPYLLQIAFTLPFVVLVRRAPETSTGGVPGPLRRQLRIPSAGHRRFVRVVVVAAPWLFLTAAIAYGYLPVLLAGATGGLGIAYATLLTGLTLGTSALVQPVAKRLDSPDSARGLVASLTLSAIGLALATTAVSRGSVVLGVVTALVLGAGLGIGLVSGILEVQRIAGPHDLAGLTGVFYAVAYCGFLTPALLAALAGRVAVTTLLWSTTALAVVCALVVLVQYRKHLPTQ